MPTTFRSIQEFEPGQKWARLFEEFWPGYRRWYLQEGEQASPGYLTCLTALREHMQELVPTYEKLVQLAGGGDTAARFLSLYRPTPYLTGCSQAVWTRDAPLLVRNYDYSTNLWEAVMLHTAWNGRHVIAMSDCLWGVLDGINESGLAVSLSFGGSRAVGDGFGIPLVLRYILEFCEDTAQAVEVLQRVPCHMAYNVTVLDATGQFATVWVGPDRPATVTNQPVATNHQESVAWAQHAHATSTLDREKALYVNLNDPHENRHRFVQRFLEPPVYALNHDRGWGTLYTATYDPIHRTATCLWPGRELSQTFTGYSEQTLTLTYPVTDHHRLM